MFYCDNCNNFCLTSPPSLPPSSTRNINIAGHRGTLKTTIPCGLVGCHVNNLRNFEGNDHYYGIVLKRARQAARRGTARVLAGGLWL